MKAQESKICCCLLLNQYKKISNTKQCHKSFLKKEKLVASLKIITHQLKTTKISKIIDKGLIQNIQKLIVNYSSLYDRLKKSHKQVVLLQIVQVLSK